MPGEHPFMAQMKDYFKLLVIDIFDEALNLTANAEMLLIPARPQN